MGHGWRLHKTNKKKRKPVSHDTQRKREREREREMPWLLCNSQIWYHEQSTQIIIIIIIIIFLKVGTHIIGGGSCFIYTRNIRSVSFQILKIFETI
jgi:hypothetical protein